MRAHKSLASVLAILTIATLPALAANVRRHSKIPAAGKKSHDATSLINTANSYVDKLADDDFEGAYNLLDSSIKPSLPAPKLELAWHGLAMQYGKYQRRLQPTVEKVMPHTIVLMPVMFGTHMIDLKIVFSGTNKVTGFFFLPHQGAWKEAPYVKPNSYSEQKVEIGKGTWRLRGLLSIPRGQGPFPAVVLVHGTGPQDMDESLGPNKMFKDIAHGLASRGVAVLRYEKRTKQHADLFTRDLLRTITVKEETVDDSVAAIDLLAHSPHIDRSKVFIAGHSLGGTLIPRIARASKTAAGFISLNGANGHMEDEMLRQAEYLAGLGGPNAAEIQKGLTALKGQIARVKALSASDRQTDTVIFGTGPIYWLDLRDHDPLVEIKEVDRPLLFLQGGRDYQVTADGDLSRWKTALADKSGSTRFKVYPHLNHLMIAGKGLCTPAEYSTPGNVDKTVIEDMADWLKKGQLQQDDSSQ